MSEQTQSSLKSVVDSFSKQSRNSLNILSGLNKIAVSENTEYKITVTDKDGEEKEITLPTFAHLKSELERIDKNVNNLAGVGETKVSVRMPDGTFRQIHLSRLETRPDDITTLNAPSQFKRKSNWFFENFVSPFLYVEFDVSGQVDPNVRKAKVKRYILNLDEDQKLEKFNEDWNQNSDVDYITFLEEIRNERISYFLDEKIIDLPLNSLTLKGNFDVVNIREEDMMRNIGGVSTQVLTRIYQLNKMTYLDVSNKNEPTPRTIDEGDFILLNDENQNTKFKVIYKDVSNQEIALERVEGYGAITPGENKLSIYSTLSSEKKVQIGINHDEHQVLFIKPIDEEFNLEASTFSPGVGFNSNELEIELPQRLGGKMNFQKFYKNYVIDFGAQIFNLGREKLIPVVFAEEPNSPQLNGSDFEVKQINRHVTESTQAQKLEELNQERLEVDTEINSLNTTIRELIDEINSTQLIGRERREREERLRELINRKESKTRLLKSTINEIISLSNSNPNLTSSGKYRVRGFWDIPPAQESEKTKPQEVIQFLIQYRYVRQDGTGSNPDVIEYTDVNGVKRQGIFSTWNKYKTDVREREYDSDLRRYVWKEELVEDGEVPNINQIDIPINYGEGVEIRIKSISEAGYPTTPIMSNWSESIIINFPENLIERNEELRNILQDSIRQEARLELISELNSQGLNRHLENQFVGDEGSFYAHRSEHLSYTSEDGEVRTLQNIIAELSSRLNTLESRLFNNQTLLKPGLNPLGFSNDDEPEDIE